MSPLRFIAVFTGKNGTLDSRSAMTPFSKILPTRCCNKWHAKGLSAGALMFLFFLPCSLCILIQFQYSHQGPDMYYYEVIECGRRMLLTGVLIFIAPNSAAQVSFLAIYMMLFYRNLPNFR